MTDGSHAGSASALAGRLPTLQSERIYRTYGGFLATFINFRAALWVFLIGSTLPLVGNTGLGIIGYACGQVLGMVPILLSVGLPSLRYGIDAIDASKTTLGFHGAFLPLIAVLVTALGWATVVLSTVARGSALLLNQANAGR